MNKWRIHIKVDECPPVNYVGNFPNCAFSSCWDLMIIYTTFHAWLSIIHQSPLSAGRWWQAMGTESPHNPFKATLLGLFIGSTIVSCVAIFKVFATQRKRSSYIPFFEDCLLILSVVCLQILIQSALWLSLTSERLDFYIRKSCFDIRCNYQVWLGITHRRR